MMEAGRELDVKVAEEVMGWHKDERPGHFHWLDNANETTGYDWLDKPIKAFSPSTKLAVAWEVEEKLYNGGYTGFELSRDCMGFVARFDETHGYVQAPAAPLAICLAALKAVEEEK